MPELPLLFDRGSHACHLFRSFAEQKAVVLPFFKEGLRNGEYCIYVTCDQPVDEWYFEFQAYGIDVRHELERGALQIITGDEWRQGGDFNSIIKAREAWGLIEDKLRSFKGVRITGDAGWALRPPMPIDQLCHWEATANLIYEDTEVRAICQYDLDKQPTEAIHAALRTHPSVLMGGRRYANPHYEAPRILENEPNLNHSDADAGRLQEMLTRLAQ